MTHPTTHTIYERRQILRDLAADVAEQCGYLLGADRSLTDDQRAAILAGMSDAWLLRDVLSQQSVEAQA